MNLFSSKSIWPRHVAIEKAIFAYYELKLRFPVAARIVASGKCNADDETESEAWRNFSKALVGLISQIYFAAQPDKRSDVEAPLSNEVSFHRDKAIAAILGDNWKSVSDFSLWFVDDELQDYVEEITRRIRGKKSIREHRIPDNA